MKYLFTIFFILSTSYLYAQQIKGFITTDEGDTLVVGNILFKKSVSTSSFKEFTIARNGKYSYTFKKEYDTLVIQINAMGYISQNKMIPNFKNNKMYEIDFIMQTDTKKLEEISVKANRRFEEKGDTVVYEVDAYKDGSERKVEDLIKKLPGIEVDDKTGQIKYKGKPVETVTLEGDNLFGQNYTLGTRNINIDMVEQVEAIENYNENPLLKDVDTGEKVALNLKLKKGKIDFSGNTDIGLGLFEEEKAALNLNANLLSITQNYKSFSTLSYNNIGMNNSPFDYFGFTSNFEQLQEKDYFADKVISESYFSNFLDDRLTNVNNQYFINYNGIVKLGKGTSVKANLYYLNDRISNEQFVQNSYTLGEEQITTTDNTNSKKQPAQYRADIEIKRNTSKNSLLEYRGKIRRETIYTPISILFNQNKKFSTALKTNDFYTNQKLLFTQKLNKKKVIQFSGLYSYNDLPQIYQIEPSILNLTNPDSIQNQNEKSQQTSQFRKNYGELKATLLGANNNDRYVIEVGTTFEKSPYQSLLLDKNEEEQNIISENDLDFKGISLYQFSAYHFSIKRFKISPSYSITYFNQKLEHNIVKDSANLQEQNFVLEPSLSINYKLTSNSFLQVKVGYNQKPTDVIDLFRNPVLTDNRTLSNNIPNLNLQKTLSYSLFYFVNNLYRAFDMNVATSYQISRGNFFSNVFVTPTLIRSESFFLNEKNRSLNANFKVGKYVDGIETTFRLSSDYNSSWYKNVVNDSELRDNRNQSISTELFFKTAFDAFINFQNSINWNYNIASSLTENNNQTNSFSNHSLQNTFRILIKPHKKWFVSISSDYFLPTTSQKNNSYHFVGSSLRYNPKNKKWNFDLTTHNILNVKNFEQIQINDFATTIFRSNILPRHVMLHVSYNF